MRGWRGAMPRVFMTMGILCIDIGCALMILYTTCGQSSQPDIDCNLICIGFVLKMIAPAPPPQKKNNTLVCTSRSPKSSPLKRGTTVTVLEALTTC